MRRPKVYAHLTKHVFRAELTTCLSCGTRLRRYATLSERIVITPDGSVHLTHCGYRCPNPTCTTQRRSYRSAAADALALPGFTFGLDCVILVGQLRLAQQHTLDQAHQAVKGCHLTNGGEQIADLWYDRACQRMDQPKERTMPTSPVYDSTRAALRQHLPEVLDSQLDTLGLLIVGAVQSMSSQAAKIARALPLDTTQVSKEQRLRRFLDNERITQTDHYQPIVTQALHGLKGQRVQLLIDRVLLRDQHNILVVSVGFRRRSIPLCWKALEHRGSSNLEERKELLQAAVKMLPSDVRISVHGDSEFRTTAFFAWLRSCGYAVMLGVVGHSLVYDTNQPEAQGQPLAERVGTAPGVVYLSQVYLTEARYGPLNVLAWWEHDADGKRVLRGAMTNLEATARTKALGKRRMWIETVFRDWQSGGFHLDQCGMEDRARVARLLIVLAIGYLWLVSVGRWVVKKGYRKLIDDGTRRNWHFSLFQLGVGWMERLHSFTLPLPLIFFLYM